SRPFRARVTSREIGRSSGRGPDHFSASPPLNPLLSHRQAPSPPQVNPGGVREQINQDERERSDARQFANHSFVQQSGAREHELANGSAVAPVKPEEIRVLVKY